MRETISSYVLNIPLCLYKEAVHAGRIGGIMQQGQDYNIKNSPGLSEKKYKVLGLPDHPFCPVNKIV